MRKAFAGVDVSFAKGKALPVAICSWENGRLVPYPLRELGIRPPRGKGNAATLDTNAVRAFARGAVDYLKVLAKRLDVIIERVGIDAPSSPNRSPLRRSAERALDRAGISCFATPSDEDFEAIRSKVRAHLNDGRPENRMPHANQLWMLVGFALFEELANVAECIEVFPQATVRAIGAGTVHKSRPGAVRSQAKAVARHTGWPCGREGEPQLQFISWAPEHDCLDAYMSAWVAALDEVDRVPMGNPPDDVIWIPRTGMQLDAPFEVRSSNRALEPSHRMLCPAYRTKEFKRWPWGWDAHAAFRCSGLRGRDPEERKEEFRRRFSDLFAG